MNAETDSERLPTAAAFPIAIAQGSGQRAQLLPGAMDTQRPVTRARAVQLAQGIADETPSPPSPNVSMRRRATPRIATPGRRTSNPARQPSPILDLPPLPSGDWDSDPPDTSDDEAELGPNGERIHGDELANADPSEVKRIAQEELAKYLPQDQPIDDPLIGAIASRQIPIDASTSAENVALTHAAALSKLHESLYAALRESEDRSWLHGPPPRSFGKPNALYRPHPSVELLGGSLLPQAAYQDDADSAFNPAAVTASFTELGLETRPPAFDIDGPYGTGSLGLARGYLGTAPVAMDIDEEAQGSARIDANAGLHDVDVRDSMLYRSFSTSASTTTADHRSLLQSFPRLDMTQL